MKLNEKQNSVWPKNMSGLTVSCYCCYSSCCCCFCIACQRSTLSLNCLCHLGSRPHFIHFAQAMPLCHLTLRCLSLCLCICLRLVCQTNQLPLYPSPLALSQATFIHFNQFVCLFGLFVSEPSLTPLSCQPHFQTTLSCLSLVACNFCACPLLWQQSNVFTSYLIKLPAQLKFQCFICRVKYLLAHFVLHARYKKKYVCKEFLTILWILLLVADKVDIALAYY